MHHTLHAALAACGRSVLELLFSRFCRWRGADDSGLSPRERSRRRVTNLSSESWRGLQQAVAPAACNEGQIRPKCKETISLIHKQVNRGRTALRHRLQATHKCWQFVQIARTPESSLGVHIKRFKCLQPHKLSRSARVWTSSRRSHSHVLVSLLTTSTLSHSRSPFAIIHLRNYIPNVHICCPCIHLTATLPAHHWQELHSLQIAALYYNSTQQDIAALLTCLPLGGAAPSQLPSTPLLFVACELAVHKQRSRYAPCAARTPACIPLPLLLRGSTAQRQGACARSVAPRLNRLALLLQLWRAVRCVAICIRIGIRCRRAAEGQAVHHRGRSI